MNKTNKIISKKDIYIWNIAGSMANAIFSVVVLMIVTRSVNDNHADIFSIAWSISQLMLIIGTFQLRTYQATDISGKYTFKQYLLFRITTIIIMLFCSFIYVCIKNYDIYKITIVLIMCLIRAVEALSDIYEGWFQQKERLDLAGKVIAYRVLISIIFFAGALMVFRELLPACIILLCCYIVSFIVYNLRYGKDIEGIRGGLECPKKFRWMLNIFSEGLPIFINAFLMMSIMNAPKMAIDTSIEKEMLSDGVQAIFSILFMPASFINLAYIVFRPLITKMAIVWNAGRKKELIVILIKIESCLLGIGAILLTGGYLVGIPLLSGFYGIDLTSYQTQLLIIIAGGCFYTFASVFDNALVAMRKHHILVFAYIVTWIYIQLIADKMVFEQGVWGAAMAYASSMFVFLVVAIALFAIYFVKISREKVEREIHEKISESKRI